MSFERMEPFSDLMKAEIQLQDEAFRQLYPVAQKSGIPEEFAQAAKILLQRADNYAAATNTHVDHRDITEHLGILFQSESDALYALYYGRAISLLKQYQNNSDLEDAAKQMCGYVIKLERGIELSQNHLNPPITRRVQNTVRQTTRKIFGNQHFLEIRDKMETYCAGKNDRMRQIINMSRDRR